MLAVKMFECKNIGECGQNVTEAQQFYQQGLCDTCWNKKRQFSLEDIQRIVKEEVAKISKPIEEVKKPMEEVVKIDETKTN